MTDHVHSYAYSSRTGDGEGGTVIYFRCKCGNEFRRQANEEEMAWLDHHGGPFDPEPSHDVHRVWHLFLKKAREELKIEFLHQLTDQDNRIRLGEIAEELSQEHPEDIFCLRCDDDHHAGSDLIAFLHRAEEDWMGVTFLVIPQCGGVPCEFFLYPDHFLAMFEVMAKINTTMFRVQESESLAKLLHEMRRPESLRPVAEEP